MSKTFPYANFYFYRSKSNKIFIPINYFLAYSSLSSVSSSLSSPAISPRNSSPVNPVDSNTSNIGKNKLKMLYLAVNINIKTLVNF